MIELIKPKKKNITDTNSLTNSLLPRGYGFDQRRGLNHFEATQILVNNVKLK